MKTTTKKYTHFIGIDVSKNELDIAVIVNGKLLHHQEIKNKIGQIDAWVAELKSITKFAIARTIFCLEHTGIYSNHLIQCLEKVQANIVIESAAQIQGSIGIQRGKSDKIDSVRIGQYAYLFRESLRLWTHRRPVIDMLKLLFSVRSRLIDMRMALKMPLQEQKAFIKEVHHQKSQTLCAGTVTALDADIKEVEHQLAAVANDDPEVKQLVQLITSVPAIGLITAIYLIITTNEFKDISDPKKFACYCGVAPFPYESGVAFSKARLSPLANKKMKSLLHICAIACISKKGELRDYYKRKTETEGKPKMAVLNAVRYKLILRAFACVNQKRVFQKDYIPAQSAPMATV